MTHKHEWVIRESTPVCIARKQDGNTCYQRLDWKEVIAKLNATEELSVSMADTAASLIRGHVAKRHLKAYAEMMDRGVAAK